MNITWKRNIGLYLYFQQLILDYFQGVVHKGQEGEKMRKYVPHMKGWKKEGEASEKNESRTLKIAFLFRLRILPAFSLCITERTQT